MIIVRPVLVLLFVLFATPAHALRCGTDLVREGDRAYQVERACGRPDWVGTYEWHDGGRAEVWHYNFGPTELMRVLHFRAGRLQRIETAGRGFVEPRSSGDCRPAQVFPGMSAHELLKKCGQPVQREGPRVQYLADRARHPHGRTHPGFHPAFVEDWYYDFGSGYLERRLRLVDGIVREIQTLP